MIRSFWRWSHLILAIVASTVLIAASISGIILSVEPIQNNSRTTFHANWNDVTLQQTIDSLKSHYFEITSIERDVNGFYVADVITEDGDQFVFQFDPSTGKKSGKVEQQSDFYSWMTSFHRSLFLDTTGRFLEGVTAVLLFFIALSGIVLVIQRTRSFKALYDKVEKTINVQYFHIVFGRLAFLPIIVVALTGGYLFLKRFELVKVSEPQRLEVDFEKPQKKLGSYSFSKVKIGTIQRVEFPLFEDESEYYTIFTKDKTLAVDQFKHQILDQEKLPSTTVLSNLSLDLHTGRKNSIWSIILGLSAISILYFIYSGFKITLLKMRGKTKNKFAYNESNIVILFGSETGNTRYFAKLIYENLVKVGNKVYLTELNNYQPSDKIQHLIVLTATYGTGDAPTSANKFIQKWTTQPLTHSFHYSIVGFGSLAYPDFCNYAVQLEELFAKQTNANQLLPLVKIHNQSYHSLKTWALDWQKASEITLQLPVSFETKKLPTNQFEVIYRESITYNDQTTFILRLKAKQKINFKSGDLLAVYPPKDPYKRNYSIGKVSDDELTISVKLDEYGICSNYLHAIEIGQTIEAAIENNKNFHYQSSKSAIFIGNGTGMGPFLGMIAENKQHKEAHLYWGGRNSIAYSLYEDSIQKYKESQLLNTVNIALSRETDEKVYVGDLIQRDGEKILQLLKNGGIIYICGSLAMEQSVLEILDQVARKYANKPLNHFQKKGLVKMDCY
ncbi:MAG: PepSY domain-containing protein [Crocinitomicaceae bacterium]|nr:PepSY domain-containing protein [Crocinitomicaceae bacterium]